MIMMNIVPFLQLPVADLIYAFQESFLPGKVIVLLLFVGSIFAWTIMVTKLLEMRQARIASRRFLHLFRKEPDPVAVFVRRQKFPGSPLYEIYQKGCVELGTELEALGHNAEDLFATSFSSDSAQLTLHQFEGIRNVTDRNLSDQSLILERRMGLLATAVTTSPFLGLLGTVWGVMESFSAMAVVGTSTLSAVAPGIAAALMTTVMGLLVALPSTIGYNILAGQISELQVQTSNFAQEFMDKVKSTYLQMN